MKNDYHAAIGYKAFDEALSPIENEIKKSAPAFLGYKKKDVSGRLVQRIVEEKLNEFVVEFSGKYQENRGGDKVKTDTLLFCIDNKKQLSNVVSLNIIFKSIFEFYIHWLLVLLSGFKSLFYSGESFQKTSLLFGVGKENFSSKEKQKKFLDYCCLGPIRALSNSGHLIVQALSGGSVNEKMSFDRFPLLKILVLSKMGLCDFLCFFKSHLLVFIKFHFVLFKFPLIALLSRDVACHAAVEVVNNRKILKSIIFTNSNYTSQPLWSNGFPDKQFSSHMIWYSMNVIPLKYKQDGIDWPVPNYRHINVGSHWLWSDYYKSYFDSIGMSGVKEVVPPVLWYLNKENNNPDLDSKVINIVVFDVTPIDPIHGDSLGLVNIYYDFNVMSSFVCGILQEAKRLEKSIGKTVCVYLKTKREYHKIHDPRYIKLLDKFEKAGDISIISHQTDIYELILSADFTVTIPNSSPPMVSAYCNKPAIYFDPVGILEANYSPDEYIYFASSDEDLFQKMYKLTQ